MTNPEKIVRAYFQIEDSDKKLHEKIFVHFNPESLQYTITNNLPNQGSGNTTKQHVKESTGKLTLDLIFDNTGQGEDIRLKTKHIAKFMDPSGNDKKNAPPKVNFVWGLYKFTGLVETYKETIDYFSADGVPLRALVNLSLSSQEVVFEKESDSAGQPNTAVPVEASTKRGVIDLVTKAENPEAAKDLASMNGIENLRFPLDALFELDASVSLQGPSGFSSSGIGLDIGGGVGIGAGISVDASLSAGVSASGGAFLGLRTSSAGGNSATFKLDKFVDSNISNSLGLDSSSIGLGGVGLEGSASLKAEVGQTGELKSRIEFDGGKL